MNFDQLTNPQELLEFMKKNIHYGFVTRNGRIFKEPFTEEWNTHWFSECIVQSGDSLLKTHYGTCWDQVELERKWFLEHNYQFKTFFMWFDVDKENNLPTHTFLVYYEKDKCYWFENAWGAYQGIHEYDNENDLISYVELNHLESSIKSGIATLQNKKDIKIYLYQDPKVELSVEEYLEHVTNEEELNVNL